MPKIIYAYANKVGDTKIKVTNQSNSEIKPVYVPLLFFVIYPWQVSILGS